MSGLDGHDEEVRRRYESGETVRAIGASYGVSHAAVSRRLDKLGVVKRPSGWQRKSDKPLRKSGGTKALPVLPTGELCACGCGEPAMGDEYASRACLSRDLGIPYAYDEKMARGGRASHEKARAEGREEIIRAGRRELALSA